MYNKEAYGGINLGLRVEENHRNGDDLNSFNQAFENSKSLFDNNGIALNTTAPGVTEVDNSSGFFEYNKGWFYNADSGIYIGTDSSAKLIVTSADKVDSYIQSEPDAFVITSQADDPRGGGIIDSIYGGNGNTEILIDGVVVANLLTGKGDDDVKVIGDENGEMPSGAVVIDTGSGDDAVVLDKNAVSELVFSEAGDDRVEILGGTQAGGVYLGDGDDSVVLNGGASVVGIYTEAGNDTVSIDEAKIDELGMGGIGFVNLGDGDDKLNAKNSDFKDPHDALADSGQEIYNINAGAGNDKVNIEGSNLKRAVLLGEGDDELNVKNSTSLHPEAERNPNESDVLFKFQNAIGAGAGDDDITLENFNTDRYVALGEGNDSLWVTNNSAVNAIFGEAGDDTIDISNASKVQNIAAGVGDDTINVTDAGTVVSGVIKGGNAADDGAESGADTFRIENGANVNVIKSSAGAMNNYVYVGGAEVGSIHMGSTQEASTGENMITVTNEAIVIGDILAGRGVDNIEISEGARVVGIVAGEGYEDVRANLGANDVITVRNAEAGFVQGGAGDDTLTISYGAHINGSVTLSDGTVIKGYVSGQQGNDTIVITGKETIVDGVVRGAEEASVQSDTITVSNEATVKGNVTGSAGNDDITINNANVESFIRGYAGDDDITVENGANVSGAINADVGNDTVSIQNSSVGGFVSGYTGNDEINISGSSISGIIEGGDGNDSISINESSNVQNVNAGNGNDAISIENSTASGWIWGFGGDNEISVSNSSVNQIFGGDGNDDITLENSSANLIDTQAGNDKLTLNNEPNINLNTVKNIETLEVRNNDGAKLELSAKDVIDMTDNRNSLNIVGEKDSSGVELSHEFTQKDGSQEYSATDSSVTFIIEPDQQ
ncbi:hypothetical protein [Campylobacter sp. 19-13652]|uniref:hypothetical protein n=1 Tax=Campylobacter sp. 19-13652 TaxID=2840180 RepID=UPI001C84449C|nr:hypothetical protein [Campylobacter sp. 19-13652]